MDCIVSGSGDKHQHVSSQGMPMCKRSVCPITDIRVKVFGELEYVFGSIKLTFIVILIILMLILDIMKRECSYRLPRAGTNI